MKITVAGTGCGSGSLYTEKFKSAVKDADKVFTAVRDANDLEKLRPGVKYMSVTDTLKYIDEHIDDDLNLCVCASGDTGFYSIAKTVAGRVKNRAEVEFLPGIGSLSYFCAKIGIISIADGLLLCYNYRWSGQKQAIDFYIFPQHLP